MASYALREVILGREGIQCSAVQEFLAAPHPLASYTAAEVFHPSKLSSDSALWDGGGQIDT